MASEKAAGKMSHGNPGTEHFGSRSLDSAIIFLSGAVAFFFICWDRRESFACLFENPCGALFFQL